MSSSKHKPAQALYPLLITIELVARGRDLRRAKARARAIVEASGFAVRDIEILPPPPKDPPSESEKK